MVAAVPVEEGEVYLTAGLGTAAGMHEEQTSVPLRLQAQLRLLSG